MPPTPTVNTTDKIIRFLLFSKSTLLFIMVFKPLAAMKPYRIIAQPPNTNCGIVWINAFKGPKKLNKPNMAAAIVVMTTDATLLKPIVAIDSP